MFNTVLNSNNTVGEKKKRMLLTGGLRHLYSNHKVSKINWGPNTGLLAF